MSTSDTESDSNNSEREEVRYTKKSKKSKQKKSKSKKQKKEKKSKESKKKTNDSESSQSEYEERTIDNIGEKVIRDDWMQNTYELKTFSKHKEQKVQVVQDKYDPRLNARELNPHWKSNGTGLPDFKKPTDNDDHYKKKFNAPNYTSTKSTDPGWRKNQSSNTRSDKVETAVAVPDHIEDPAKKLNELSAKKIKAEIMGNTELAAKLDLEIIAMKEICEKDKSKKKEEHILLTHTDARGNVRPLANASNEFESRHKKCARVDTHKDGERVRYFLDDDKYDIKQMFEREKGISAADANLQFANMTKDPKAMDDEPETLGTSKSQRGEVNHAIQTQQKLDSCELCFDSKKCAKHLVVKYHRHFYLSLPWYIGLQMGHCFLTPIEHCIASTYLDEDSWEELKTLQRSLVQMYAAQNKDVVFYETAKGLKWRNHMRIHCVPIPRSEGEMVPFYFKKAIEESEEVWSVNKQLVSLKNKDLIRSIPKGLPYFWINFGLDSGFAHVIEEENRFPNNFAEMPGVTVKDIDQHAVVKAVAVFLKKTGKLKVPEQMEIIKTAKFKELAPADPDWFYIRCASILRHLYHRSPAGVGSITKIYGGRKRNGVHPSHFCRAADGCARKALQSLEHARLIEKHPDGGRKLTSTGQRDLDRIANQIVAKQREALKVTGTLVISK